MLFYQFRDKELRNFRWAYQMLLELAINELRNNPILEGHRDCKWNELVGTSHSMYLHVIRDRLGIDHEEFLAGVRAGEYPVDDLYDIVYGE